MSAIAAKDIHTPKGGGFLIMEREPRGVFTPEDLTPEQRMIGDVADEFVRNTVLPQTERLEQGDHELMHRLMRQAGDLGLLGADVPEVYGGLGLPLTTSALIAEKINPQQSFALTHEAHSVIATLPLMFFGNNDQKFKYLPRLASGEWIGSFALSEANSGSDALALKTRAELSADGGHYVLNGEKMWITNSAFATLFTVFARVGDEVTGFLVERDWPGVSLGKEEHKLGMHGTSTRRVILDKVRVPAANALEVGKGHYAAFCALNLGRFKLEAGAVGGIKELLAICAVYAAQRKAFGKTLSEFGLVQAKLAQMCARAFSLESMIYRLADDMDAGFSTIDPQAGDAPEHYHAAAEEYSIECNIVKVVGSEAYSAMADEAIQIHGGYGYTEEFAPARAWRDQRLLRIGEGANEIVRVAITSTLLKRLKQGRLDLLQPGAEATREMTRAEAPIGAIADSALDSLKLAAGRVKRLALFLLHQAHERLGAELAEYQEIAGAIADVVCAAYALESICLRLSKHYTDQNRRSAVAMTAAQAAARFHREQAAAAARYALDCLPAIDDTVDWRDEPFTGLANVLTELIRYDESPLQQDRELARAAVEARGWPIGA